MFHHLYNLIVLKLKKEQHLQHLQAFQIFALEFLKEERLRLKSIEEETKVDASEKNAETSSNDSPKTPALHTRSRSQKSLFEFGEDAGDPWSPILDGRDINRQ